MQAVQGASASRSRTIIYINEAVVLDRDALELCPPGHPKQSVLAWFEFIRVQVVVTTSSGDGEPRGGHCARPRRTGASLTWSPRLFSVFEQYFALPPRSLQAAQGASASRLRTIIYINEAVVPDRDALELCLPGHPKQSVSLVRL